MNNRREHFKELLNHLYLYTSQENYKYYDYYAIPCIEEIKYNAVYHDLETNMKIEVFKELGFINILGLTREELEIVEDMLHIYIYFKGGER